MTDPASSDTPSQPLPIAVAVQLRRVIDQVLPGLYAYRYSTLPDSPPDDADNQIVLVSGAAAAALQALATMDGPMLVSSHHQLSRLSLDSTPTAELEALLHQAAHSYPPDEPGTFTPLDLPEDTYGNYPRDPGFQQAPGPTSAGDQPEAEPAGSAGARLQP